ncbi:hypothetical protein F750_7133 (plasmid) [Streptomyces sp. PAMC 26508]|nr:hypothetical protein F750_7133 [Streptomyces sp. PAMC 26508]
MDGSSRFVRFTRTEKAAGGQPKRRIARRVDSTRLLRCGVAVLCGRTFAHATDNPQLPAP